MARQFTNYGSTSEVPEVAFGGENRNLRVACDGISTNIYTIKSSARNLRSALNAMGTARDTQGLREQVHVWQLSANQVVKATTSDVGKLTTLARSATKAQKLQAEKIINHFKEAVKDYSTVQLAVAEKLRTSLPRQQLTGEEENTSLVEEETREQLQMQQDLLFDTQLLEEREQRIREIESDILDVNQLMRELGAIVHDQQEQIDSIESNIESTRSDVELASNQLQAAATYQNKARKRNIFLLLFLFFILAVLIGIIVWSSR